MTDARDSELTIVRADTGDCERVARLFDLYRQFYGQPGDLAAATRFIGARLEAADSVLLLAVVAEQAVGFTQLYPTYSSVAMRRVWILNDLYVLPECRRRSVGRALLGAAKAHAQSTDASRLVLATGVDNTKAKSLYEGSGWALDADFDHYAYVLPAD